jgi:pantothenate kinase
MGAPDTFDVDALVRLLGELTDPDATSETIPVPGFDRAIEEPVADAIAVPPAASTVVLEGNYLLLDSDGWQRVGAFLDLGFYVEVDPELRRQRLVDRHIRFGKTPDAARAWARGPDEANAELIETTRARADYLIALG